MVEIASLEVVLETAFHTHGPVAHPVSSFGAPYGFPLPWRIRIQERQLTIGDEAAVPQRAYSLHECLSRHCKYSPFGRAPAGEGVTYYRKTIAEQLRRAVVWSTRLNSTHHGTRWAQLTFLPAARASLLIMVWRRDAEDDHFAIAQEPWVPSQAVVDPVCPARDEATPWSFGSIRSDLIAYLPHKRTAHCFESDWAA